MTCNVTVGRDVASDAYAAEFGLFLLGADGVSISVTPGADDRGSPNAIKISSAQKVVCTREWLLIALATAFPGSIL